MTTHPMLPLTIVARKASDGVIAGKKRILSYLNESNISYQVDNHPNTLAGLTDTLLSNTVQLESVTHGMLMSIGGDGSLLRLIPHAAAHNLPIIGINLGRVGFLADLKLEDLTRLTDIIEGLHTKDSRPLIEAVIPSPSKQASLGVGLNELCIKSAQPGKALIFTLTAHNHCFQYQADGYIIASPTGSTAYALSAGGPVITPDLNAHLMLPICPHMLSTRPMILPAKVPATIQLDPHCDRSATIFIDGRVVGSLAPGQRLVAQQSQHRITLVHPENYDFLRTSQEKLHWKSC